MSHAQRQLDRLIHEAGKAAMKKNKDIMKNHLQKIKDAVSLKKHFVFDLDGTKTAGKSIT